MDEIVLTEPRRRTTTFLGPSDRAICTAIAHRTGDPDTENRSRAIRYALKYWADRELAARSQEQAPEPEVIEL